LPAELLETAARIFRAEALDGYRDRKVIGGLAGFVERLGESLPDVGVTRAVNLLRDYAVQMQESLQSAEPKPRLPGELPEKARHVDGSV